MFKDRQGISINFKDNIYKQASLGFSVQRGTKQHRGILRFINSRVMIISNQDNKVVFLSSLLKIS
jgi:hypothetical protein